MAEGKAARGRKKAPKTEQVKAYAETSTKAAEGLDKGTESGERELTNIERYNAALTPEERREKALAAASRSGAARRRKSQLRDACKILLSLPVLDDSNRAELEALGVKDTMAYGIALAQAKKAMEGDTDAARFVRDTGGEKPREAIDMAVDKPIQARDMSEVSDEELEAIAEGLDEC